MPVWQGVTGGLACAHQACGHFKPANAIVQIVGHVKETSLAHCETRRVIELCVCTDAIRIPPIGSGNGGHCATRDVDLANPMSRILGNVGSCGIRCDREAFRLVEPCICTDAVLSCPRVEPTGNCGYFTGSDDHLSNRSALLAGCRLAATSVKNKEDRTVGIRCTRVWSIETIVVTYTQSRDDGLSAK